MSLLQMAGEPYPRFVCEGCDRLSESQRYDELLAAGWREPGFQMYMCALCVRMRSEDRPRAAIE